MRVIIAAAVIPAFLLIYFVYTQDKIEKEPLRLLFKLFFFGGLTTISASILEAFGGLFTDLLYLTSDTIYLFVENFIVVALVEEAGKHFVLRKVAWKHPAFDFVFDGVVYGTTVSLGFGAFENILYVFTYGVSIAPLRAFTAIPLHCIVGIYMGHYFGLARRAEDMGDTRKAKRYMRLSMLVPVFIHGLYDYLASVETDIASILFIILVILLDIIAFKNVRKYAREDAPA